MNEVKALLGKRRMSARELASVICTPERTVQDWAAGRTQPGPAVLLLLRGLNTGVLPSLPRCRDK